MSVCCEPGCPTLVAQGTRSARCDAHRRAQDKARGTRQQRGYDTAYDHQRRRYQLRMEAGEVFTCWRCAELGKPHDVDPDWWHLGHDNADRSTIRGPQCPPSNLDTSTSRGA